MHRKNQRPVKILYERVCSTKFLRRLRAVKTLNTLYSEEGSEGSPIQKRGAANPAISGTL